MLPSGKQYEVGGALAGTDYLRTVFQVLQAATESVPDKTALVQVERGIRLTYRELYVRVAHFAAGLNVLGLEQGDKLVVCLPNWPEFVIALYAAARVGIVVIPVNPRLRQGEIEFIVQNSGARAAVVADKKSESTGMYDIFCSVQTSTPGLEYLIPVDPSGTSDHPHAFERVLALGAAAGEVPPATVQPNDLAAIVYTSGTTGVPKGARLRHQNLLFSGDAMNQALENSERDVILIVVPVCHVFGLAVCIMAGATKSTAVLMERFSPETVFQTIERERVTVHHGVSTMFVLELNHPDRRKYDLSSLRTGIVAATPCPYEIVERIRTELGLSPILSYGMTETSPALTASHFENEAWVYQTVGRVLPGVTLRVVNEVGDPVPYGDVGELVCQTPGLMENYHENETATRRAIDERGWFHTGDLATLNEAGYVTIVGRIKEMINRGGLKIYPREVEERLYEHPAIQEVAVVGVPDPVLGERSCACITLKPGESITPEEARTYCREHLADYKVPDFVEVMEALPLNSSGKIYKLQLGEMMRERHPPVYHV
ncbi:class I adenylate-forming enzyme family protein [Alicyclobacillus sp. ALC3]|uniref:class I adenylate-forming enzyme family protein n=1 Tax=Alicyclobacillus sp. ALC3 TaxID=2796143 RepID=UPI002379D24E|nr:AMP-binding protein [Alicyclobacillus sp. ALC3]WDL95672.1 AMP-binding protein [Alicyclobacillus sp. ALC3]